MRRLSASEFRGLWAVLWRVLIFGPILGVFGLAFLLLVLGVWTLPPIYALYAFYSGDWLPGLASLVGWAIVVRFGKPVLKWTLQGIEYASI